jgi:hypothetical protein
VTLGRKLSGAEKDGDKTAEVRKVALAQLASRKVEPAGWTRAMPSPPPFKLLAKAERGPLKVPLLSPIPFQRLWPAKEKPERMGGWEKGKEDGHSKSIHPPIHPMQNWPSPEKSIPSIHSLCWANSHTRPFQASCSPPSHPSSFARRRFNSNGSPPSPLPLPLPPALLDTTVASSLLP